MQSFSTHKHVNIFKCNIIHRQYWFYLCVCVLRSSPQRIRAEKQTRISVGSRLSTDKKKQLFLSSTWEHRNKKKKNKDDKICFVVLFWSSGNTFTMLSESEKTYVSVVIYFVLITWWLYSPIACSFSVRMLGPFFHCILLEWISWNMEHQQTLFINMVNAKLFKVFISIEMYLCNQENSLVMYHALLRWPLLASQCYCIHHLNQSNACLSNYCDVYVG